MHIYEVIYKDLGESHIVVAKSQKQAVEIFTDYVNSEAGFDKFFEDDFLVNEPLEPENYYEPTVIN